MWIADAAHHPAPGDTAEVDEASIDAADLDYVIREAVVAQVRKPDDSTTVSVSTDDTQVSKTYRSGPGRVTILGEWWEPSPRHDEGQGVQRRPYAGRWIGGDRPHPLVGLMSARTSPPRSPRCAPRPSRSW